VVSEKLQISCLHRVWFNVLPGSNKFNMNGEWMSMNNNFFLSQTLKKIKLLKSAAIDVLHSTVTYIYYTL
jgi:hypothetical protein